MSHCDHNRLGFTSTEWGEGSYRQPSIADIREALGLKQPSKKAKTSGKRRTPDPHPDELDLPSQQTFPAPLVKRDDELYHDPEYPPQSVQEWYDEEARNEVTAKRRTIYVVPPPKITHEANLMVGWTEPRKPSMPRKRKAAASKKSASSSSGSVGHDVQEPGVADVAEYLQAFYCGLPVKILRDQPLRFTSWDDASKANSKRKTVERIALETGKEAIQIRCRQSPDKVFDGQLDLNDILDAAISILSSDAYALLMLVHQDLYEGEEDDFCCGRAYGGSRVAVVSSARYRPQLDTRENVDLEHPWPASHCQVSAELSSKVSDQPVVSNITLSDRYPGSALAAGVDAFNILEPPNTSAEMSALWLGRVCKTASHELGHCFGIDHCTYYACVMQGTANIAEDARQPPYLCPVDLAKVLRATGSGADERYSALLRFCERWSNDRLFAAFAAWIRVRLHQNRTF